MCVCICVYIYCGIRVNLIELWRYECIGAFIQYSIDTVCAFYLISPSTTRLRVFASMKFVYFFRCSAKEMSISCWVFELKSNATASINQRLQFVQWKREGKTNVFVWIEIWIRKVKFKWPIKNQWQQKSLWFFFLHHFYRFFVFVFLLLLSLLIVLFLAFLLLRLVVCLAPVSFHSSIVIVAALHHTKLPLSFFSWLVLSLSCHFQHKIACSYILACSLSFS